MTKQKYPAFGLPSALASIRGVGEYSEIRGKLELYEVYQGTMLVVEVERLPDTVSGFFGFHVHEGGSCSGDSQDLLKNTGSHYNPFEVAHPGHAGDLPPLLGNGGKAWMAVYTGRFYPEDVIGRTIVIHDMPDDFHSQPSGDSGMKIACGMIYDARAVD